MICNFMIFSESVGSGASLSARRRSMTANCTETSGYKAGRFSFSGPARATAAPASVPTVPTLSLIHI